MFGKTHGIRSIGMAVAAAIWGMAPFAAQAIDPPPPPPQGDVVFMAATPPAPCAPGSGPGEPLRIATEPRAETVTSAPYSGVGTTEVVTTLADGNRIVRTNTMKYYRDGRGRTRTEYSLAAIGPFTPDQAQTVVTITDPVEKRRVILHSVMKRADIFKLPDGATVVSGTFSSRDGGVGFVTRGFRATTGPRGPAPTQAPAAGAGMMAPPVAITSVTAAALPPANAGFIMQYGSTIALPDGCKPNAKPLPKPASIGERIVEGLKVTGTRNEFTIAAGAVGNEQPIVVSSEQWFSPELGVVVESTHRDPMMGDTKYKLEQISRAEPDPALFAIPADYTQNEMPAPGMFFEQRMERLDRVPPKGMTLEK